LKKLQSRRGKGFWQCDKEGHIAVGCPGQMVRAAKQLLRVTSGRGQQPQQCLAKQQNMEVTSKASHQNILEANQGDWQKELVVKTVVPQNRRELREFLKRANHYHRFVKNYTAVVKPLAVLTSPKVKWAWCNAQQAFNN